MKRILLLLTAFATLLACTKNDPNPVNPDKPSPNTKEEKEDYVPDISQYGDIKINEGVVFFDQALTEYVTIVDEKTIRIKADIPANMVPKTGQILFCPLTPKTPEGFVGTVSSISKEDTEYLCKVKEADLADVFEDIDIQCTAGNIFEDVDYLEDEDGKQYKLESSDKTWSDLFDEKEDESETKAAVDHKPRFIPVETEYGAGQFYVLCEPTASVKKLNGQLIITVESAVKTGFEFNFNFKKKGTKIILPLLKKKSFPIPVGRLFILNPSFTVKSDLEITGEASLDATINLQFSDEIIRISNESGSFVTTKKENGPQKKRSFNPKFLELDADMSINFTLGLQYYGFNESMFTVGVEAKTSASTKASLAFSASQKKLLEINPNITLSLTEDITAFVFCKLFPDSNKQKYETLPLHFELGSVELNLLPVFDNLKKTLTRNSIKASGTLNRECYISSPEQGYALFKKGSDTPLAHKACYMTAAPTKADTASDGEECEATFDELDNPSDYEVKAYVVAQEGEYYYKPIQSKRVTSVRCGSGSLDYSYDSNGNVNWMRYYDGTSGGVSITQKGIDWEFEHCTLDSDGCISTYWVTGVGNTEYYASSDGHVVSSSFVDYSNNYIWSNGDYITTGLGGEFCDFSYSDNLDKTNINIMAVLRVMIREVGYITPSYACGMIHTIAPGLSSTHLPSRMSSRIGNVSFSYNFDDEGYVTDMTVAAAYFDGSVTLSFEYE